MAKTRKFWHAKERWRRVTKLMARDGLNCTICEKPLDRSIRNPYCHDYITFDHIVPRSLGGDDLISNLRLAHAACNWDRGNDPLKIEDEAGEETAGNK